MFITFDEMTFLMSGRPSLESAQKYLSNGIYNILGFVEKNILPKKYWRQYSRDI